MERMIPKYLCIFIFNTILALCYVSALTLSLFMSSVCVLSSNCHYFFSQRSGEDLMAGFPIVSWVTKVNQRILSSLTKKFSGKSLTAEIYTWLSVSMECIGIKLDAELRRSFISQIVADLQIVTKNQVFLVSILLLKLKMCLSNILGCNIDCRMLKIFKQLSSQCLFYTVSFLHAA